MKEKEIEITTPFIKLDSLLKFAGEALSGGMAKDDILTGKITVNGEICTMRGKKIKAGDIVESVGFKIVVKASDC